VTDIIDLINDFLWSYVLIVVLLGAGLYFTLKLRSVQFCMIGEMCRLLVRSGEKDSTSGGQDKPGGRISSFQAFAVSLASRVGTGNVAGGGVGVGASRRGAIIMAMPVGATSR